MSRTEFDRSPFLLRTAAVLRWMPLVLAAAAVVPCGTAVADEDDLLFTPPGFNRPGEPKVVSGAGTARVRVLVRDRATGEPAFCRVNVVGSDGHYYQPKQNYLTPYGLTGQWPDSGRGNRKGKGPFRYYGRFFYSWGETTVQVPPGPVRVEVWKGFEYRPQTLTFDVVAGDRHDAEIVMERTVPLADFGYYSGDPHIHLRRKDDADEQLILDLMEAEDIQYGTILAYNEPAGPYTGAMETFDTPQFRGLGVESIRTRGGYHILSGQEYRSTTYGHLNLFHRSDLPLEGQSVNANDWPLYGQIGRDTQQQGGFAFYAHGGYAQAIYADFVQGTVNGVELLQFGVYRGIGLEDWYHIQNIGYRFPCTGACDYPACRKLGDCKTFVHHEGRPSFSEWLGGLAEGRSFVSTGPVLLLEVDGRKPGATIEKTGAGPHRVTARVRVASLVAPVTDLQLIVNGQVVEKQSVSSAPETDGWLKLETGVELTESSWIAARAFSTSASGDPDAEAHTNPVWVIVDGMAPYRRDSLDRLIERIDGQIAAHKAREFDRKADVLAYFERSRDILLTIREAGGVPAKGHPAEFAEEKLGLLSNPGARLHSEDELKEFLKPVPPKMPEQALETFETAGAFHMELVASEPLVFDPIAAAIDENGNLYVCEMRDYPFRPQEGREPIGSVRLLRDLDGDGRYDESHVFADKLLWAGGVVCWKGGVFVAAPPDIWYLKDTDGDHVADLRKKVFTGFGTQNQQAMVNNLTFGLDHKVYGATAGNGGMIRPADAPAADGIPVNGHDFRFDPAGGKFETITGTIQFGNSFDDWSQRFVCSESRPLLHVVLPQEYLQRNPYLPFAGGIHDIAGGGPVPIYRISPIERWRHIRSSRRIAHGTRPATAAGASHHVIDAAAGVTVYRGGAYPKEYYGNVFIGGAQNNIIHRRVLTEEGVTFRSERADAKTEFVRSSDNWFRPVNFINAPDGTLYVLDMSREILESIHIPLDVMKHLDLTSGRDQGRIYRIAPTGFRCPAPPRLAAARTDELVPLLEHPSCWWRDTAHRLLYERGDQSAAGALRRLMATSRLPQARLHALWSLEGLGCLEADDLLTALSDDSARVREHAVRITDDRLDQDPRLLACVLALASDPDDRVRYQVAFSLGETKSPQAVAALAEIARSSAGDPWIRTAVLSSVAEQAGTLFQRLLEDRAFAHGGEGAAFLEQLASIVGVRHDADELSGLLENLTAHPNATSRPDLQQRMVLAAGEGLKRSGRRLRAGNELPSTVSRFVSDLLEQAAETAGNGESDAAARQRAVQLLACAESSFSKQTLLDVLDPTEPPAVQIAGVRALAGYDDPDIATGLLQCWRGYVPEVRAEALQALLGRSDWTVLFLEACRQGDVSIASLDAGQRSLLLSSRSARVKDLAVELLGDSASGSRSDVVAEYRTALSLKGDAKRGQDVFFKNCKACHRFGKEGFAIGPDLASSPSKDPEALLIHVLDPNRYVLPNYTQYVAVDQNGRTLTGLIAGQTATSITLKREENKTDTLLRTNVLELVSTGKSLMPEGFEKKISKEEMADLLAFLGTTQEQTADASTPLDIGTLPGLVEPQR